MCPTVTIGSFTQPKKEAASPQIRLTMPVNDFLLDWRRYNLVSNYIAEYSAYYFMHKDRAENLISSIFYELIDHVASNSTSDAQLDIKFATIEDWLVFEISSCFSAENAAKIADFIKEVNQANLDVYFKKYIEADLDEQSIQHQMGLIMIAHDYHARLGVKLEEKAGSAAERSVTLQAAIKREEITT